MRDGIPNLLRGGQFHIDRTNKLIGNFEAKIDEIRLFEQPWIEVTIETIYVEQNCST